MTNLADLIAGAARGADMAGTAGGPHPCRLGRLLADMTDTDRNAALIALHSRHGDDGFIGDEALAAVLTASGRPVSIATLSRHRRGVCTCRRPATYCTTDGRPAPIFTTGTGNAA